MTASCGDRHSSAYGLVVVVVHRHDAVSGGVQDGGGNRGAVAGAAVDPDLAVWNVGDLVESLQQVVQGNVQCLREVRLGPLLVAAYVQDDHRTVVADRGELGEARGGIAAQ